VSCSGAIFPSAGALDMPYVGFLALGVFVGCVVVLGFKQAQNDFAKGGTAILQLLWAAWRLHSRISESS
jgi:hypothetical protein